MLIILALSIALTGAIVYALTQRAAACRGRSEVAEMTSRLGGSEESNTGLRIDNRALHEQVASERQRVEDRDEELKRIRDQEQQARNRAEEQSTEIRLLKDAVEDFKKKQDHLGNEARESAERNRRIESTLLDWTRQISSPQGRGAFGELALRNQLLSLGLAEGRDFQRQVSPEAGGQRRVDYVVRLGEPTVAIDSKLASDPGLGGLSDALAAGESEELKGFGRKLRDHAKALAAKDYWRGLEQSPSLVLMYVPVEGAQYALSAVDGFDATKFFNANRVCIVTPSQLSTALVLISEVCHAERKEARIQELLDRGYTMADAIGKFLDNYAKLGRHLGQAVNSFNSGAAMTTTHGMLWQQVVKPLSELAPGREVESKVVELEPPRDDVPQLAERYRETAAEMAGDEDPPPADTETSAGQMEAA